MFHKDLLDRVGQELGQCYKENPLCVDNKILSSLKPDIQLTTTQIAWFFALYKVQQERIDTIVWDSSDLIACVQDLENTLVILVEDFLKEQEANIRDDVSWEAVIITRVESAIIPTYIVSRPVFIRLFSIWVSVKGDINPSKAKNMIAQQQDSIKKAWLLGLDRKHLTDHLRSNLHILCSNNPVRLSLDKIPETIWLKDLAHYLAITAKRLNDYGDVNYDCPSLIQNAKRIHDLLWQSLKASLTIYWTSFRHMKPEHRELAIQSGVIQIERYGNNPERNYFDDWSALVSKRLALRVLNYCDELSNLVFSLCHAPLKTRIELYRGDAINIAVVQHILPELFPRKDQSPCKKLGWNCFQALPDILNRLGAEVTMYYEKNKNQCRIEGSGKQREIIKIDFDAFRQRFKTLFKAYIYNASCEEIEY